MKRTSRKRWTKEEAAKALELLASGMMHKQVGYELGRTYGSIGNFVNKIQRGEVGFQREAPPEVKLPTVKQAYKKFPPAVVNPKTFISPMEAAKAQLRGRLTEKNGSYYLDGQPAKLNDVMRATNRALVGLGAEQILNNPVWRVE